MSDYTGTRSSLACNMSAVEAAARGPDSRLQARAGPARGGPGFLKIIFIPMQYLSLSSHATCTFQRTKRHIYIKYAYVYISVPIIFTSVQSIGA